MWRRSRPRIGGPARPAPGGAGVGACRAGGCRPGGDETARRVVAGHRVGRAGGQQEDGQGDARGGAGRSAPGPASSFEQGLGGRARLAHRRRLGVDGTAEARFELIHRTTPLVGRPDCPGRPGRPGRPGHPGRLGHPGHPGHPGRPGGPRALATAATSPSRADSPGSGPSRARAGRASSGTPPPPAGARGGPAGRPRSGRRLGPGPSRRRDRAVRAVGAGRPGVREIVRHYPVCIANFCVDSSFAQRTK